jgi:hypothetical protein
LFLFFLVLGAVVVGVPLLLWFAHRRRAVLKTALITIPLSAVIWVLDWAWINTGDPTGAGGAFDCWPSCSFEQDIARVGFMFPPLYVLALLVALAVRALIILAPGQRRRAGGH